MLGNEPQQNSTHNILPYRCGWRISLVNNIEVKGAVFSISNHLGYYCEPIETRSPINAIYLSLVNGVTFQVTIIPKLATLDERVEQWFEEGKPNKVTWQCRKLINGKSLFRDAYRERPDYNKSTTQNNAIYCFSINTEQELDTILHIINSIDTLDQRIYQLSYLLYAINYAMHVAASTDKKQIPEIQQANFLLALVKRNNINIPELYAILTSYIPCFSQPKIKYNSKALSKLGLPYFEANNNLVDPFRPIIPQNDNRPNKIDELNFVIVCGCFDYLSKLIVQGDLHSIKEYLKNHPQKLLSIINNKPIQINDITHIFLAILLDKVDIVEYFIQNGFSLSYYDSCQVLGILDPDFEPERQFGPGNYPHTIHEPFVNPIMILRDRNTFAIETEIADIVAKPRTLNYLEHVRSTQMAKLLCRYGANTNKLYLQFFSAIDNNDPSLLQAVHNYGIKANLTRNNYKKINNYTLLEYCIYAATQLAEQGETEFFMLRLLLRCCGFMPERVYNNKTIPYIIIRILIDHNKRVALQLSFRANRPKIHDISISRCGRVLITTYIDKQGNILTSNIVSTADLHQNTVKEVMNQVHKLYYENFEPDDNSEQGYKKHFHSKVSPDREKNQFIEIVFSKEKQVIFYFSFQIIEQEHHPLLGKPVLFSGLSTASKRDKRYAKSGLATLTLRIPPCLRIVYPERHILVKNNFLARSASFGLIPAFVSIFSRYSLLSIVLKYGYQQHNIEYIFKQLQALHQQYTDNAYSIEQVLIELVTKGTDEQVAPDGTVAAKASVKKPVRGNLYDQYKEYMPETLQSQQGIIDHHTACSHEHYHITKGDRSKAVAGIYSADNENDQLIQEAHLTHHNFSEQHIQQTAFALSLLFSINKGDERTQAQPSPLTLPQMLHTVETDESKVMPCKL